MSLFAHVTLAFAGLLMDMCAGSTSTSICCSLMWTSGTPHRPLYAYLGPRRATHLSTRTDTRVMMKILSSGWSTRCIIESSLYNLIYSIWGDCSFAFMILPSVLCLLLSLLYILCDRHLPQLLVRGDNVVLVCYRDKQKTGVRPLSPSSSSKS